MAISPQPRASILGVFVSALNLSQALAQINEWIACQQQVYVCVTPAHAVMDCHQDPHLRRIYNASGMTTPDGMSIVWLLKLKGYPHTGRVYGPDLMLACCQKSVAHGWRHFLYGGSPEILAALEQSLQSRFPQLKIVGRFSPPFRSLSKDEDDAIVTKINNSKPDIVWVGIGSPKQEIWMAEHRNRLNAPVLIGVGAAFDFLSGAKKQAPRWVQNSGMEWLFRFITEPRRLWRRYIRYPLFASLVLAEALGIKRFPTD